MRLPGSVRLAVVVGQVLTVKHKRGRSPFEMGCKGTIAAAVRNELKGSRHGESNSQGAGVRGRRAPGRASAEGDHQLVRSEYLRANRRIDLRRIA